MSANPTCPGCGNWLRWDGAQWRCDRCGAVYPPQQQAPQQPQQPQQPAYQQPQQPYAQPQQQPYAQPQPPYAQPQAYPQQPYAQQPAPAGPAGSKRKLIIIGAVALLAVGLAVVLILTLGGGGGGGPSGAGSPQDLAKAAASALNRGDGGAYLDLIAGKEMQERVMDCKKGEGQEEEEKERDKEYQKMRERLAKRVARAKGAKLEVKNVAPLPADDSRQVFKAGADVGGDCKAKVDHVVQTFMVEMDWDDEHARMFDLRVDSDPPHIQAVEVGGRWYLLNAWLAPEGEGLEEEGEGDDGDGDEGSAGGGGGSSIAAAIRELESIADAMCACKDKACADAQTERMNAFAQRHKDTKGSDAENKRAMDAVARLTECSMKLQLGQ